MFTYFADTNGRQTFLKYFGPLGRTRPNRPLTIAVIPTPKRYEGVILAENGASSAL